MITAIEPAQRCDLQSHSDQERREEGQESPCNEAFGQWDERGGEIRSQHVERAMSEVHQVHDTENKREARRKQEQQQPELQTVEALLEEEHHRGMEERR